MRDVWTEEDDVILAEAVLRHIREGSPNLDAFDEVGRKLDKSAAACGFRWNTFVRNGYVNAINFAKEQRNHLKNISMKQESEIKRSDDLDELEKHLKKALKEVELMKQGKLRKKSARDMLREIKKEMEIENK